MERIQWHATDLNTPVVEMESTTPATISCDSGLPEGTARAGRDYAVVLHQRDGAVRVIAERVSLNAAEECRDEIKRRQGRRVNTAAASRLPC